MNSWSIKLLQNTVKNITKKVLLPAFVFLSLPASLVEAQITPDGTLETQVEIIQQLMEINGGLREGNNLFHSFEDFNIPEGMEASFQNAIDIENIFTRVTGDSISNINGILSTQGAANFFFMNPNGIVFGENASINVGGSFMATTADSINFEDGTAFAANDTNADPILTTNEPSGLTFDGQPGAIEVYGGGATIAAESNSTPTDISNDSQGLSVSDKETLALIGGKIEFQGGIIRTSGNIKLGSVSSGEVDLGSSNEGLEFGYGKVSNFQDITLSQEALINSNGSTESNSIGVFGADIQLSDSSKFLIQNTGNTSSGNININATGSLRLERTDSNSETFSSLQTEALGQGKAGDISVTANDLILKGGGRIETTTFDNGEAGSVAINARNSIQMSGSDSNAVRSATYGSGNSGSLQISTSDLQIFDSGGVSSATRGSGAGGNVVVNAESIELIGASPETGDSSFIAAVAPGGGENGNAGEIIINTSSLSLQEGGAVTTSTFGSGNAGNITINSSEKIKVSGEEGIFPSTISSSGFVGNPDIRESAGLPPLPSGEAGNVNIMTPSLNVNSGGEVSVRNEGTGSAGILSINADDITLENQGSLTAASVSGQGGNIEINAEDININRESTIEATAENQGGGGNVNINASNITAKKDSAISANATGGDGGNVSINSDILLGIDNSDITANAVEGDGGNITINADFIIGFEERVELTPFSDIVASSEFGQSGTININSPESTAEEDVTVNAREIESVEAGEFLKAVCPNRDNRYGKKTFQYYARGVPEGLGNYHDYDEEEILKDLPVHQKIERETYRHSTEPPSLPDANSIPDTYPDYPDQTFEGRAEPVVEEFPYTTSPLQVIYSQTNQVPPTPRPRKSGEPAIEANAVQINPDGSKHFIRVAQIEHPQEQMCVRPNQTYSSKK